MTDLMARKSRRLVDQVKAVRRRQAVLRQELAQIARALEKRPQLQAQLAELDRELLELRAAVADE